VARLILSPFGLFMGLPLLIFPCTIKSRSSLQAPAHPVGPGKRAVKRLCVSVCYEFDAQTAALLHIIGFPVTVPRAGSGAVSKWVICACDSLVDFGTV